MDNFSKYATGVQIHFIPTDAAIVLDNFSKYATGVQIHFIPADAAIVLGDSSVISRGVQIHFIPADAAIVLGDSSVISRGDQIHFIPTDAAIILGDISKCSSSGQIHFIPTDAAIILDNVSKVSNGGQVHLATANVSSILGNAIKCSSGTQVHGTHGGVGVQVIVHRHAAIIGRQGDIARRDGFINRNAATHRGKVKGVGSQRGSRTGGQQGHVIIFGNRHVSTGVGRQIPGSRFEGDISTGEGLQIHRATNHLAGSADTARCAVCTEGRAVGAGHVGINRQNSGVAVGLYGEIRRGDVPHRGEPAFGFQIQGSAHRRGSEAGQVGIFQQVGVSIGIHRKGGVCAPHFNFQLLGRTGSNVTGPGR